MDNTSKQETFESTITKTLRRLNEEYAGISSRLWNLKSHLDGTSIATEDGKEACPQQAGFFNLIVDEIGELDRTAISVGDALSFIEKNFDAR